MLLPITIIVLLILVWWFRRPKPGTIPVAVERLVVDVMANVDDIDSESEGDDQEFFHPKMKRKNFLARLVRLAKSEFGLIPRTQANKLMVRKFLRDHMREKKMRPSHIVQHLDVSVACFFIPSEQEIIAHQLGAAREAHNRDGLINSLWDSAYGNFGRMLGFKSE